MSRRVAKFRDSARSYKVPLGIVYSSLVLTLLVLATLVFLYQRDMTVSFIVGGLIQLLPNMYFARQVFRFSGAAAAHRVTQSFYRGEMGKFLFTGAGFALAFAAIDPLVPQALFGGFVSMLVCHTLGVARISR